MANLQEAQENLRGSVEPLRLKCREEVRVIMYQVSGKLSMKWHQLTTKQGFSEYKKYHCFLGYGADSCYFNLLSTWNNCDIKNILQHWLRLCYWQDIPSKSNKSWQQPCINDMSIIS
jgi:hypothetical protein